jgi:4-hydroxy-tetrahydrodipicolinate synthase
MPCAGLWPPAATPFRPDLSVNLPAFVRHCRRLLAEGADGLAVLGTTSEANSLALAERREVVDALIEDGIPADKLLPGTGACAIGDAVELSRRATEAGCAGVLLLPPFFYKGVPDAGLFDYVARVVDAVADDRLRIYLYHIPQMAGAGWSLELIGRLTDRFPAPIAGLKDSTGDWDTTRAIIEAFPALAVFPANEAHLSRAIPLGAAGCISATANVNAAGIAALLADLGAGRDAVGAQAQASAVRKAVEAHPLVPAVKAILARRYRDPDWAIPRPPLQPLRAPEADALFGSEAIRALDPLHATRET